MSDNCHVDPVMKQVNPEALKNAQRISLAVSGMGCSNCALRVQNSLINLEGVLDAHVDHNLNRAEVVFNPRSVGTVQMVQAVADAAAGTRHLYQAQVI